MPLAPRIAGHAKSRPRRPPGPVRWQTGLIYGIQLGLNFVTYVRTPILYVVVALALASGSAGHALWLIAVLNLGRWAPL